MQKLDLLKQNPDYYTAGPMPELAQMAAVNYLSVSGSGDPSSGNYEAHIRAIYAVAYGLKFLHKALNNDFVVAKLEAIWWVDDEKFANTPMEDAPAIVPRNEWNWRLLIRVPDYITRANLSSVISAVIKKKNFQLAARIELVEAWPALVAQILHLGPFETEIESLRKPTVFVGENGLIKSGPHHEIYLSDFRKVPSEKLRTILPEPAIKMRTAG